MISILAFGFGCVAGSLVTQHWTWVRGVAGKARDAVLGSRPARTLTEVRGFSRDDRKLPISAAVRNLLGFFAGLLSWCARNPIVAVGLIILALWLVMGSPFAFGKSKGQLRLEREIAEANAQVHQLETRMAELSRELAVNSERDRNRRATVIAQAEQDLGHAVAQVDPDALFSVYEQRYLCVLDASTCASGADPAPAGAAPVRGSSASPV